MKTYRVRLMQTVIEEAWLTVQAADRDAAMQRAAHIANGFDLAITADWSFCECVGDIEAVDATEVPA